MFVGVVKDGLTNSECLFLKLFYTGFSCIDFPTNLIWKDKNISILKLQWYVFGFCLSPLYYLFESPFYQTN